MDVKKIIEKIIELKPDVLENGIFRGEEFMSKCPFHDTVDGRPFGINLKTGVFNCFTCLTSGDMPKLIVKLLGFNALQEFKVLLDSENFSDEAPLFSIPKIKKQMKINSQLPRHAIEYLKSRNITYDTAKRLEIGYSSINNSLVFPIYNKFGKFICNAQRKIGVKAFYIPSPKPIGYANLIKDPRVFITEGIFDCISLIQEGFSAICLFGIGTNEQFRELNKMGGKLWLLAFDNDTAGKHAVKRASDALQSHKKQIRWDYKHKDINELHIANKRLFWDDFKWS